MGSQARTHMPAARLEPGVPLFSFEVLFAYLIVRCFFTAFFFYVVCVCWGGVCLYMPLPWLT